MKLFISLLLFLSFWEVQSQQLSRKAMLITEADSLFFENFKRKVATNKWETLPLQEFLIKTGTDFLNTPYVSKTLDIDTYEWLVVNFRELDCTTFVETCLALTRTLRWGDVGLDVYCSELEKIRYRDGIKTDFTSRKHYFSEWISNNQALGIITDLTQTIGGDTLPIKLNYMSRHPQQYKQLASNRDFLHQITRIERKVSSQPFFHIPKNKLPKLQQHIQSGDIIAITTTIEGLDIAHVGFALWQNQQLFLLHASSSQKKVCISQKPLFDYLQANKTHAGIMVLRLTNQ